MNMLRYALAGSICFVGFYFLKKSKSYFIADNRNFKIILKIIAKDIFTNFLPYSIIILLASGFHKSALIMLPLYFIIKINLEIKFSIIYAAIAIIFMIFKNPIVYFISEHFFNGAYNPYKNIIFTQAGGTGYIFIPLIILLFVIILYKRLIETNNTNIILINMCVFNFMLYAIAAFSIYIITRFTLYIELYNIIIIPEMLYAIAPNQKDLDFILETKAKLNHNSKKIVAIKKELDSKKAYWRFGIGFCIIMGFIFFSQLAGLNGYGVFPYASIWQK
jgi:hypothetical protein